MASFAFIDGSLVFNSVTLTTFVTSMSLNVELEELEDTAMGDVWRNRLAGLKDYTLDVEFNSDFAASAVDATLWTAFGLIVPFTIKATTAATSATNPAYTGGLLVSQLAPIGGSVGELGKVSVTWPGSGALSRATS